MVFGVGNDERAGGNNPRVSAQLIEDDWAKEECDFWWDQSSNVEELRCSRSPDSQTTHDKT